MTAVTSPYDAAGNLVDTTEHQPRTGRSGSSRSHFDKQANNISDSEAKTFVNTITEHIRVDGLTVAVTGQLAENANNQSFSSTGLGVLLALIVLLLVFGSFFAAILPDHLRAVRARERPSESSACSATPSACRRSRPSSRSSSVWASAWTTPSSS